MKIEDLKPIKFDELDYFKESEIKCPYCNYKFLDSWEAVEQEQDNREIVECESCQKSFYVNVCIDVSYTSTPLENEIANDYKNLSQDIKKYGSRENNEYSENKLHFLNEILKNLIKLFEEHKEQFESEEEE